MHILFSYFLDSIYDASCEKVSYEGGHFIQYPDIIGKYLLAWLLLSSLHNWCVGADRRQNCGICLEKCGFSSTEVLQVLRIGVSPYKQLGETL